MNICLLCAVVSVLDVVVMDAAGIVACYWRCTLLLMFLVSCFLIFLLLLLRILPFFPVPVLLLSSKLVVLRFPFFILPHLRLPSYSYYIDLSHLNICMDRICMHGSDIDRALAMSWRGARNHWDFH